MFICMCHEHVSGASAMNLHQQSKACVLATCDMQRTERNISPLGIMINKTNGKERAFQNNPTQTSPGTTTIWAGRTREGKLELYGDK